jgi:GNAT superfamily N-acetyltransferase
VGADPDLVAGWLHARSIARGLPLPVPDCGGWRVNTRSEVEFSRYVFAAPTPEIVALSQKIDRTRIFIKLCTEDSALRQLLSTRWQLQAPSWMMTAPMHVPVAELPTGYRVEIDSTDDAVRVQVFTQDGTLAASGYAAEAQGVFVYDRIVTAGEHRRRGLGRVVMSQLSQRRRSGLSRNVLVATVEGRALYTALGWQVHAPYASAVIPEPVS